MRLLVTGVAGFIGSRTAELLLEQGHQVFGVDNLCPTYDVRLKEHRLQKLLGRGRFDFRLADIGELQEMGIIWATGGPFDAVINLAARAGVRQSVENPWAYIEANVTGTLNLLELCRQHRVGKFVLASTSSLYGSHNRLPFSEDADTDRPLSPYAASKKGAEALCWSYHYLYGMDVTVFRYFTVYGPAGRPDMSMFRFVQWIAEQRPLRLYGDGSQSRDFTYVDDIARGTALGLKHVGYEVVNLGSDHPFDLLQVIRLIEGEMGQTACIERSPMPAADVQATWANIGKAEQLFGWRPQVSLEKGVARLCDWYRENREWASSIDTDD